MADPKTLTKLTERNPHKIVFKYPSEDETYVRRLGAALLAQWSTLDPALQEKLLAEANIVWDREYNIPQLAAKLEAFVKRHPSKLTRLT
jgi:hypothetical protein